MAKSYFLRFGTGDPRSLTGLSPTFLFFRNPDGTNVTPPSISEVGTSIGIYTFTWGTTNYIGFLADAATTSPGSDGRYVVGALDPVDRMDEVGTSLIALGTSHIAQGVSILAIGTSHLAQGVSIIAQNVSLTAQSVSLLSIGTTLTGYGVSAFAQGATLFGFGVSNLAQGVSITAQGVSITAQGASLSAQGSTLFGIGTTLTGYGVSAFAQGSTLFGIGTTLTGFGVSGFASGSTLTGYAVSIYAGNVSLYALGLTLGTLDARIGATTSTFGDSSTDPGTIYGYLKRVQEFLEGDATFTKSTGAWAVKSRGGTLLASKTLTNTSSAVTKD